MPDADIQHTDNLGAQDPAALKPLALHALHEAAGAKFAPFAGFNMPLQYARGVMQEHLFTRNAAGLFDVSHMGQVQLIGRDQAHVAAVLERVVPSNIATLKPDGQRYSVLLNPAGGIVDDLIIHRDMRDGVLNLVINASRRAQDLAFFQDHLGDELEILAQDDLALLALQGPKAAQVLTQIWPEVGALCFMQSACVTQPFAARVSRAGYTGEDGFEISLHADHAALLRHGCVSSMRVEWIGLGARDSLRLEAGLPLYGQDLDETTSPIEAGLGFVLPKRRRQEANFLGAARVIDEFEKWP